jgi:NADH-quinone oxidoreductase subunit C
MHSGEGAKMRDADLAVQLSERLAALRDRIVAAFGDLEVEGFRGELTLLAPPDEIVDLLTFCRDDPEVRCELLSDLSGVHWPAGKRVESQQETTGWPTYESGREEGWIDVCYLLSSLTHGHRFRVRVRVRDVDPVVPSVEGVYRAASFMERETFDFFGVTFDGHADLKRLHMPDDWDGHPQRKDYPLGGVDVQYKGGVIPPPDERHY